MPNIYAVNKKIKMGTVSVFEKRKVAGFVIKRGLAPF